MLSKGVEAALSSHFRCGVYWKMLNGIQAMIIEKGWLFQVSQIVFQIPKQLGNAFQCIKSRFRYSLESRVYVRWNERLRDVAGNFALNKIPQMHQIEVG